MVPVSDITCVSHTIDSKAPSRSYNSHMPSLMPYLMPSTYRELGRTDGIFAGDLLEQLMCFTVDKQQTQLWVPTHLVAVLGTSGVE